MRKLVAVIPKVLPVPVDIISVKDSNRFCNQAFTSLFYFEFVWHRESWGEVILNSVLSGEEQVS